MMPVASCSGERVRHLLPPKAEMHISQENTLPDKQRQPPLLSSTFLVSRYICCAYESHDERKRIALANQQTSVALMFRYFR